MSQNNNIIINDNQIIDDIPKVENPEKLEIIRNENDQASFNQLLSLQILIQKHSCLKELCKFFFNNIMI